MSEDIIGVDLGGTHLRAAIVRNGRIFNYMKKDTPKNKKDLLDELCDSISQLMNKNVIGIGVATPGPLKDGIIKNPPNLPWKNFNLKKYLQKKFKVRVEVGNDADCVAISEAEAGCRKKNFMVFTLGTGIGGGIIINGELFRGEGYGGEPGHMIIHDGRDMEDLWKDHRRDSLKYFGKVMLVNELFKMKDKRAMEILENAALYLGQGIASLVNALDPAVVILAGGPKETGKKFLKMIQKNVNKYSILPKKTPVKWTSLPHPGTLGASLLIK